MILGSGPNAAEDGLQPHEYDLCRRPTGGGLVDHRDDWTYTLVVPRGHPLEADRAAESYRKVHAALAEALQAQGVAAKLQPAPEGAAAGPGVCFGRAEANDVIHAGTGAKIAGAAQKRNKRGLLLQGSVWRPAAGMAVDWDRLGEEFAAAVAAMLGTAAVRTPWPDWNEEEVSGLTESYSAPEWMAHR
jgi:lipoate-protein ligase A